MNDKIDKDIAIVVICLLLIVAAYSAVSTSRELGDIRRANIELESRNRELTIRNSELTNLLKSSTERLERVAGAIAEAQGRASKALDSISRIRILVEALERVSLELRKPIDVVQQ